MVAPLPLPSLSLLDAIIVGIRQSMQVSVLWCELATDLCRDSHVLQSQTIEVRLRSRHLRAERASLRVESVALCPAHAPLG
jgi:hypothetical protein